MRVYLSSYGEFELRYSHLQSDQLSISEYIYGVRSYVCRYMMMKGMIALSAFKHLSIKNSKSKVSWHVCDDCCGICSPD